MSAFSRIATSFVTARKLAKARDVDEYLNGYLKVVDRAELPVDPELRKDHKYRALLETTHGKWMEDGAYICSCGEENQIFHYQGKHPLRRLQCGACDRVFNDDECFASEILTPIKRANIPTSGLNEYHVYCMGQMCPQCGLTHRVGLREGSSPDFKVHCLCDLNLVRTGLCSSLITQTRTARIPMRRVCS